MIIKNCMSVSAMYRQMGPRRGFALLELLLVLAIAVLAIQLSAALRSWIVALADIRQWSRTSWFVANLVAVVLLAAIRFGPEAQAVAQQFAKKVFPKASSKKGTTSAAEEEDYEQRRQRHAEWRERAKKRLPFT
jgi:prepilin-type N-terminal cleavage/methylation domain-containing protein